jgi:2,3-dihydroxyphenylpropionate 1,2-dioxygenase
MPIAAVTMSHSPLLDFVDPPADVKADVDAAFAAARSFVREYDPEVVINFAPDHYNGFFYDIMPPACIGYAATAVGDFGTGAGPLNVSRELSERLAQHVLDDDLDIAVSLTMQVDHGAVQPLEILFGGLDTPTVVPVFLNSVAPPFSPLRRIRLLGESIARFAMAHLADKRVLLVGSGGLSHEPPVPQLATAQGDVLDAILGAGRNLSEAGREARQTRVINAARQFAAGESDLKELAPEWDRRLLELLSDANFDVIDSWTPGEMTQIAGNSSHEVRTWIAAYAAMNAAGPYAVRHSFYRPIREYIAGFGVTTVVGR